MGSTETMRVAAYQDPTEGIETFDLDVLHFFFLL